MHKFWSRKPHNIVAAYITNYSRPGEVVLDPFGGSGVTLNEALRLGRRVISFDTNPLATFISRNTIARVDYTEFERLAKSIYDQVSPSIECLYSISCPACEKLATITHVLWRDVVECRCGNLLDLPANPRNKDAAFTCSACGMTGLSIARRVSQPYRFYCQCSRCGTSTGNPSHGEASSQAELAKSAAYKQVIDDLPSLDMPLVYPNGFSFLQLRHGMRQDPRLRNLFTPRNLIAVHAFWKAIEAIPAEDDRQRAVKDMLRFTFSSMLPQASKMVWVIKQRERRALGKYEVGSWTHHFFWNPTEYFEVNVAGGYRERVAKILNGLRAKSGWEDGAQRWCKVCIEDPACWWLSRKTSVAAGWRVLDEIEPAVLEIAASEADFFANKGKTALVETRHSQQLAGIPDASIDYIFTDPPYGDSIQYAELAAFFLAWQHPHDLAHVLQDAFHNEITVNAGQGKDFGTYKAMLGATFRECFRVLKPGRYMTVTFHDTDARVRGLLYDGMLDSGFSFQQTVYQPPPRPSEKSLLHAAGSPTGDYIITFVKPFTATGPGLRRIADEGAVLKQAIDSILSRRGEPVPFSSLLSLLDLQLVEMGFMPPDMSRPLDRFLHEDPGYVWIEKQGWFFRDAEKCGGEHLQPLHTRVEEQIARVLPLVEGMPKAARLETLANSVFAALNGVLTPDLKGLKRAVTRALQARDRGCEPPCIP
ncbi:MAG: DNA methyltransferase [Candidatus Sigynarchaeota archaeon]